MAAFPAQQAGEALHPPLAAGSGSSKGQVQTPKDTGVTPVALPGFSHRAPREGGVR